MRVVAHHPLGGYLMLGMFAVICRAGMAGSFWLGESKAGLDRSYIASLETINQANFVRLAELNDSLVDAGLRGVVDRQAAELRDILSNKYFPIDVGVLGKQVDSPPVKGGRSEQVLELEPDGTFAATKGFIRGPVELQRGMGLDGWMVFEAPPDTKFREFKWRAGDNLTITF